MNATMMTDTTQYPFIQLILGYADARTAIYTWHKEHVDALAAELHSLLTSNAVNAQLAAEWEAKHHALRTQIAEMGREMASVVAERDALKAQQPKAPERKLREVRFGGYDDLYRWNAGRLEAKVGYPEHWVVQGRIRTEWLDEVNALRADPYEPVETVEDIVREHSLGLMTPESLTRIAARLRAWLATQPQTLCNRMHYCETCSGSGEIAQRLGGVVLLSSKALAAGHLPVAPCPDCDGNGYTNAVAPFTPAPRALTAQEHVDALVKLGAMKKRFVLMNIDDPAERDVLILPTTLTGGAK